MGSGVSWGTMMKGRLARESAGLTPGHAEDPERAMVAGADDSSAQVAPGVDVSRTAASTIDAGYLGRW